MHRLTSIAPPIAHLVGPGKLKVTNRRLAYSRPDQTPMRLDPKRLRQLYCYGKVSFSDEALRLLCKHEIEVALLRASNAECIGRLVGPAESSSCNLRLRQYALTSNPQAALEIARWIVTAKIASQAEAARHYQRHGCSDAKPLKARFKTLTASASKATSLDQLRGHEGTASKTWFELFSKLLREPWTFKTRNRRPPKDPVNAPLNLSWK